MGVPVEMQVVKGLEQAAGDWQQPQRTIERLERVEQVLQRAIASLCDNIKSVPEFECIEDVSNIRVPEME